MRNVHEVLFGEPEVKKPFEKTGRKWEDNIKMDWIYITQYKI